MQNSLRTNLYPSILNKTQATLLHSLAFLKKRKFYLAGGTALALQIGHRTSVDLDFDTDKRFESEKLGETILSHLHKVKILHTAEGTLQCKMQSTEFSFFFYDYPLIRQPVVYGETLLASIPDIAAMKAIALVQRGKQRDFIDLYFLLKTFTVADLLHFVSEKYPAYSDMLVLRAVTFFDDADSEQEERGIKVFEKGYSWSKAKKKIFEEVRQYQLSMIPQK